MTNLKKSFKLIKKLNLTDKAQKKKTLVWKDVIEELNSTNVEENVMK
jgi:ribosomal protein L18E